MKPVRERDLSNIGQFVLQHRYQSLRLQHMRLNQLQLQQWSAHQLELQRLQADKEKAEAWAVAEKEHAEKVLLEKEAHKQQAILQAKIDREAREVARKEAAMEKERAEMQKQMMHLVYAESHKYMDLAKFYNDILVHVTTRSVFVHMSADAKTRLGFEAVTTDTEVSRSIVREDMAMLAGLVEYCVSRRSASTPASEPAEHFDLSFRCECPSGRQAAICVHFYPIVDPRGQIKTVIGAVPRHHARRAISRKNVAADPLCATIRSFCSRALDEDEDGESERAGTAPLPAAASASTSAAPPRAAAAAAAAGGLVGAAGCASAAAVVAASTVRAGAGGEGEGEQRPLSLQEVWDQEESETNASGGEEDGVGGGSGHGDGRLQQEQQQHVTISRLLAKAFSTINSAPDCFELGGGGLGGGGGGGGTQLAGGVEASGACTVEGGDRESAADSAAALGAPDGSKVDSEIGTERSAAASAAMAAGAGAGQLPASASGGAAEAGAAPGGSSAAGGLGAGGGRGREGPSEHPAAAAVGGGSAHSGSCGGHQTSDQPASSLAPAAGAAQPACVLPGPSTSHGLCIATIPASASAPPAPGSHGLGAASSAGGASSSCCCYMGPTSLSAASLGGSGVHSRHGERRLAVVRSYILEPNRRSFSPLGLAALDLDDAAKALQGVVSAAELMCGEGTDVGIDFEMGCADGCWSPLVLALLGGDANARAVAFLLEKGVDTERCPPALQPSTPLLLAVSTVQPTNAHLLIAHKANVNAVNKSKRAPPLLRPWRGRGYRGPLLAPACAPARMHMAAAAAVPAASVQLLCGGLSQLVSFSSTQTHGKAHSRPCAAPSPPPHPPPTPLRALRLRRRQLCAAPRERMGEGPALALPRLRARARGRLAHAHQQERAHA